MRQRKLVTMQFKNALKDMWYRRASITARQSSVNIGSAVDLKVGGWLNVTLFNAENL